MKIYIDILIITNTIVTLICLEACAKLTHTKIQSKRLFIASSTGGLTSLLMIIPAGRYIFALIITIIKFISYPLITAIAFRNKSIRSLFKKTVVFFVANVIYSVIVLIIWDISDTKIIFLRNYTIYYNISLLKLTIAVILTYLLLTVFEAVKSTAFHKQELTAVYSCGGYTVKLPAIADTGNRLHDCFTGSPVVIFFCDDMYYYFGLDNEITAGSEKFRLISYDTISSGGLIAVTYAGELKIYSENSCYSDLNCCIGITRSRGKKPRAILDPEILQ